MIIKVNAANSSSLEIIRGVKDYEELPAKGKGIIFKPEWHEDFDKNILQKKYVGQLIDCPCRPYGRKEIKT